jgi:hypothetical protein
MSDESDAEGSATPEDPPGDWVLWNDEAGGPATWVYRPDTFDADAFPAACIPTIHVTNRQSDRRPPGQGGGAWRARLTLEPDVELDRSGACPTRSRALERATEIAGRFTKGDYDVRGAYHDPSDRERYLDRLSRAVENSSEDGAD